jgi:probable FeS assembly SUF system protein SufT
MFHRENVTLQRDVAAIQIPDGTPTLLPAETPVLITQELGGSYTVMSPFGAMFRIDGTDADALGKEASSASGAEEPAGSLEERVWGQMRKCFDPEIPVNIVDLGLVYDCRVEEDGGEGATVHIQMTLTAPGCGMGPVLAQDVQRRIEAIPGVARAAVEVVFDPPWNQNMMSEAAKLQLGFL